MKRAKRESISSFIQFGGESVKTDRKNFDEKIRDCEREIEKEIEKLDLTERQIEDLSSAFYSLLDVYFDEGMKIGINLFLDLIR